MKEEDNDRSAENDIVTLVGMGLLHRVRIEGLALSLRPRHCARVCG